MVRKELADTGLRVVPVDMDVDMDENTEELSFIPSAVNGSAGLHEPEFMCDRQRCQKGFKYYDIASVMVEDSGELHTRNCCRDCYNPRQSERKEPVVNNRLRELLVAAKRSRGKLAVRLGTHGLEQKIMEI